MYSKNHSNENTHYDAPAHDNMTILHADSLITDIALKIFNNYLYVYVLWKKEMDHDWIPVGPDDQSCDDFHDTKFWKLSYGHTQNEQTCKHINLMWWAGQINI